SNTSRFPFNSHCSPAQSPPKHCRKPVLSSRTYEAVPNLRQVLDCASPLALWNGAVRTPAKPSTSPLPPSSILNPLSSVFIEPILPCPAFKSVIYRSFDTIFFLSLFSTKNGCKSKNAESTKCLILLGETGILCRFSKSVKKP